MKNKDYRVEIKVKNNLLFKEIEAQGYVSLLSFSNDKKLTYPSLVDLVSMKKPALLKDGSFCKPAIDIATALKVHPEFLFNDEMKYFGFEKTTAFVEMDNEEVQGLLSTSCSQTYLLEHAKSAINGVMKDLTPRERDVLNKRFGLNGETISTLEIIAEQYGVSRNRILQIQAKAMRKMTRPDRKAKLKDYMN